jgi:hypothetical protein
MNIKFGKKWCIGKSNVILRSKFGLYCNFEIAILNVLLVPYTGLLPGVVENSV